MNLSISDLKGKGVCVFGLKGSGKSVWTRNLINQYTKHLIVDPMLEYRGFKRYIPMNRTYHDGAIDELDLLASTLVIPKRMDGKAKVDLFGIVRRGKPCRHLCSI